MKLPGGSVTWAISNSLRDFCMRPAITFRQAATTVLLMAGVQLALQFSLFAKGMQYAATSLTIDDTYYYLQTAWNTRQLGFVTFDGLHPTNGVQFLWFAVILLLAFLTQTKTALLFATLAVTFLLNGLCYVIILKIAAILQRPTLALLMAGLWALQCLPFRIYSMGMENSLHALVFWSVVWQGVLFLFRVGKAEKPNIWGLTLVLILNAWTRLDSALLSAVLYVYCMARLVYAHRQSTASVLRRYAKGIAASSLAAGLGLIVQVSAFRMMGGSFLPVSALVKTSGAARALGPEAADKLVQVLVLGMPSALQGRLPALALVLLGILGLLIVLGARVRWPARLAGLLPLADLWSCLLISECLYHLYVAVSGVQYTPYFAWYRSPSFIFWIVTVVLLALLAIEQVAQTKLGKRHFNFSLWSPAGFCLASFGLAIYLFVRTLGFTSDLYTVRYSAAQWIAEHYTAETVFAAWNTGQLGYFADRTFINLDGVINSVDYFERVLRDGGPLTDYLYENNVAYVVDYATYDALPDFPVVHSFPLNDGSGRVIKIWQVPPQLSRAP
jgi:hypothetical protein